MKVGILTFQRTLNYGAILQMFALFSMVKELGYECEIVDYECQSIENSEIGFSLAGQKTFKQKLKNFLMGKEQFGNLNKFNSFLKDFIVMSDKRYNKKNFMELENDYDQIIVGSDQVWNLELTGYDFNYFLSPIISSKKKKSYAASFGCSKIPNGCAGSVSKYLDEFEKINVREKIGKELINNLLPDKKVDITLDPTLVFGEKWYNLLIDIDKKKERYIFVYMPNESHLTMKNIKKVARKLNLKIYYLHRSFYNKIGVKNIKICSPLEFLKYIRDAEMIITGSYHALCFSILFKKEFFYTVSPASNRMSRLLNLVETFKLQDRFFEYKNVLTSKSIDYDDVYKLLKIYSNFSLKKLQETLKVDDII